MKGLNGRLEVRGPFRGVDDAACFQVPVYTRRPRPGALDVGWSPNALPTVNGC